MKITVKTGQYKRVVEAQNPYEAVKSFFRTAKRLKAVGLISSCESDELGDTYYVSNQRVLEELGMWGEKP